MPRLPLLDRDTAPVRSAELLDRLAARGGAPGPMVRAMASSPALLGGYLELSRAMKRGTIDRRVAERASLAVQQQLGCEQCLAAHTEAARRVGLSDEEIALARQGTASEPEAAALVAFAVQVLTAPSSITDGDVQRLRELGWRDEHLAEVVGLVALNLLTGSFNLVAGIRPAVAAEAQRAAA